MADQAKGYAAGTAAGNVEAENQRGMQSSRLALEAAQAAAARQRALEQERLQTQRMALEAQANAQANQLKLQALDRQKAETAARQAKEPSADDTAELERVAEVRRRLLHGAITQVSPEFGAEFETLLGSGATNFREFSELVDALESKFPNIAANKTVALRYGRSFFDAAAGKKVNVSDTSLGNSRGTLPFLGVIEQALNQSRR
jgi:hypothetical protein